MADQVVNADVVRLETKIAERFEDLKRANESGNTATRDKLNEHISDLQGQLNEIKATLNRTPEQKLAIEIVSDSKNFKEFISTKTWRGVRTDKTFRDFVRNHSAGNATYDTEILAPLSKRTVTGNVSTDADGGYGVPIVIEQAVARLIVESSPVRQACSPVTIGTAAYNKIIDNNNAASGWVSETGTRSQTNAPTFGEVTITPSEMYSKILVSYQMLEDVQFDAETTVITDAGLSLARTEATAFVSGSGSGQPSGFNNANVYTPTGYATTGWNVMNTVASHSATAISADDMINLIYGLPVLYRGGASFAMSREIIGQVRLLKDSQNRYLWSPDGRMVAGQPSQLLGYDVLEFNDMPTAVSQSAASYPIVFANFPLFYRPVDRVGLQLLRDPYTNADTGCITYRFRKRVGGGIENGAAGITLACAG